MKNGRGRPTAGDEAAGGARGSHTRTRLILGAFLAFLILVGLENQLRMPAQLIAYRNDAYVQRLRDLLREEWLGAAAGRAGAPGLQEAAPMLSLGRLVSRPGLDLPATLRLVDGPPATGKLAGLGHPFLGGRAEHTIWLLTAARSGGIPDIQAIPEKDLP